MTARHFLDDPEADTLAQLIEYRQELVRQHRLAQIALNTFIQLCAARRGLDPNADYRVTPRGELLPEGSGVEVHGTSDNVAPGSPNSLSTDPASRVEARQASPAIADPGSAERQLGPCPTPPGGSLA